MSSFSPCLSFHKKRLRSFEKYKVICSNLSDLGLVSHFYMTWKDSLVSFFLPDVVLRMESYHVTLLFRGGCGFWQRFMNSPPTACVASLSQLKGFFQIGTDCSNFPSISIANFQITKAIGRREPAGSITWAPARKMADHIENSWMDCSVLAFPTNTRYY